MTTVYAVLDLEHFLRGMEWSHTQSEAARCVSSAERALCRFPLLVATLGMCVFLVIPSP